MTSNCIIDPNVGNYGDRIWTRSIVGWPGVNHLEGDDFGAVIRQAQDMNGFPYTEIEHLITVGFGRQTLLNAADTVIDLVSQKNCATSSWSAAATAAATSAATSPTSPAACRKTA